MEIAFRPWQLSDLEALVRYANNPNVAAYMTDGFPHPYSVADGQKYLRMVTTELEGNVFAITHNNEAIGSVGVFPETDVYRINAHLGYWVAEPFWGNGIATQAIKWISAYAFRTFGVTRLYAKTFGKNAASHRALQKAGFELEAITKQSVIKRNVVMDEHIYALRHTSTPTS